MNFTTKGALLLVVTLTMTTAVNAGTHTRSWTDSNSHSVSITISDNLRTITGIEVETTNDTITGGLSDNNRCSGAGGCSSADNTTSWGQEVITITDLSIATTGTRNSTTDTVSCLSQINVNGLNASEGWTYTDNTVLGNNKSYVSGTIKSILNRSSLSTNHGAEHGTTVTKTITLDTLDEVTRTTMSSDTQTRTWNSSLGQ